jgi:DNA repair protein RadC
MAINHWPENERPREKLVNFGPQALSDAELLAILIRTGRAGHSAVSLGRELIGEHGGLREVMDLNIVKMCEHKGLGPVTFSLLQACLELGRRYLEQGLKNDIALTSSQETRRFLRSKLRHRNQEVFACLFLDAQHRVLRYEELFFGTIDGAAVYPRQVVSKAIEFNAAAVIFSHNHPSGHAEPSQADRQITKTLIQALSLIDVRVLDHVIVGDTEEVSFAERGLL